MKIISTDTNPNLVLNGVFTYIAHNYGDSDGVLITSDNNNNYFIQVSYGYFENFLLNDEKILNCFYLKLI